MNNSDPQPNQVYRIHVNRGGHDQAFSVMVTQVQDGWCQVVTIPAFGAVNPEVFEAIPVRAPSLEWKPVAIRDWPRCFRRLEARRRLRAGLRVHDSQAVDDDHQLLAA